MPTYEYACTACGERTEAKQSFTDPPLEVCTNCGGKLRKLFSPVGVVFKGSGFYSTDAKKKASTSSSSGDSKSSTGDSGSSSSGESKSSSSGDGKPSSREAAKAADKPSKASGSA
ncbi:MAG: FmdB family transcriptional regulator [Actinomycetota bacterium]|nr:FmdB family transcriptional regulator [Actinomycetota bacterium]